MIAISTHYILYIYIYIRLSAELSAAIIRYRLKSAIISSNPPHFTTGKVGSPMNMVHLWMSYDLSIRNSESFHSKLRKYQSRYIIYPSLSHDIQLNIPFLDVHDFQIIPFLLVTIVQPRRLGHALGPGDLIRSAEASAAGAMEVKLVGGSIYKVDRP